jgi:hypothetical protein
MFLVLLFYHVFFFFFFCLSVTVARSEGSEKTDLVIWANWTLIK